MQAFDPISSILGPGGHFLPGPSVSSDDSNPLPLPSILPTSRFPPTSTSTDTISDDDPGDITDPAPSSTSPLTSNAISSSHLTLSSSVTKSFSSSGTLSPQTTPKPAELSTSSDAVGPNFTSIFTSTSKGVVITVTTVIKPSGSLAPPPAPKSFFQNKTQEGIVFTVVILGVALFSFLGYRFYKTVKNRQQRNSVEEARSAGRYRAHIDDDDDFPSSGIVQVTSSPPMSTPLTGDTGTGASEGLRSSEDSLLKNMTPTSRPHSPYSTSTEGCPEPRSSIDTQLLFTGVKRSNTTGASTIQSDSRTLYRSPTTATTRSKSYYLSQDPLPPPLILPDSFGDDVQPNVPQPRVLEDDEDYHSMVGRVLKITNE